MKVLKIPVVVEVCVVTMADVANATEMPAYERDMMLSPLETTKEEFVKDCLSSYFIILNEEVQFLNCVKLSFKCLPAPDYESS